MRRVFHRVDQNRMDRSGGGSLTRKGGRVPYDEEIPKSSLIALVLGLQPASLVERRIPLAVPAQSTQPRQGARLQKWPKRHLSGRKAL